METENKNEAEIDIQAFSTIHAYVYGLRVKIIIGTIYIHIVFSCCDWAVFVGCSQEGSASSLELQWTV